MNMPTYSLGSSKQESILMEVTTMMQEMLKGFTDRIHKAVNSMVHEMQSQLATLR